MGGRSSGGGGIGKVDAGVTKTVFLGYQWGGDYEQIASYLREGKETLGAPAGVFSEAYIGEGISAEDVQNYDKLSVGDKVKLMDKQFGLVSPSTMDSEVYRGANSKFTKDLLGGSGVSPDNVERLKGTIIGDDSFVATSKYSNTAKGFMRQSVSTKSDMPTFIKIKAPKGSKYIDSTKSNLLSSNEGEVLLGRGSTFKILDAGISYRSPNNGDPYLNLTAELTPFKL